MTPENDKETLAIEKIVNERHYSRAVATEMITIYRDYGGMAAHYHWPDEFSIVRYITGTRNVLAILEECGFGLD